MNILFALRIVIAWCFSRGSSMISQKFLMKILSFSFSRKSTSKFCHQSVFRPDRVIQPVLLLSHLLVHFWFPWPHAQMPHLTANTILDTSHDTGVPWRAAVPAKMEYHNNEHNKTTTMALWYNAVTVTGLPVDLFLISRRSTDVDSRAPSNCY